MLTGERRGVRRGMTVLGKIPAVPKPINLPSQRLENRGLDPNVEIVPRGTVSWAGPSSNSPWSGTQPSSPPVNSGAWGNTSSKTASTPAWVSNTGRPSSAGSARLGSEGSARPLSSGGPRPSSAGSHLQDVPRPSSAGTEEALPAQNVWGPAATRSSQADGPPATRPRSAESGRNSRLSNEYPNVPPGGHWGPGHGRKPESDGPQSSRFTLSNGDFPTLGSEKNPNLRPQQRDRSDDRAPPHEEKPPSSGGSAQFDEYYHQGPRFHEGDANGWPFRPPMDRDGYPPSNTWRREGPHDPPPEDHWRIPGGGGPYGPGGPPRFPNRDFVQRFGPPGSYGRGAADGFAPPFMRPERPGHHFAPGMFPGPYDGGYYYPPPNYSMEEMMWGGPGGPPAGPGPGRYFQPGPHDFPRPPHGSMGPRPRPMPPHAGYGPDSEGFHPDHKMKEGDNEFKRSGPEAPGRHEQKRSVQGRPFGQRDWGNEEPMDFSKPVFEKEPPAATKNHKVTFKAEPSVADVAILRKPQPGKSADEDQQLDKKAHEEVSQVPAAKLVEDKRDNAAGVLGKCPAPVEDKTSADATKGSDNAAAHQKGRAKAPAHESEREWRPKQHPDNSKQSEGENQELSGTDNAAAYDYEAQRAKMKEIAAQRARQLQKEEEERIKEMRAKAQAKLDELNRRSGAVPTEASSSTEEIEEARVADDKAAISRADEQDLQEVKAFIKADPSKRRDRRGGFKKERSRAQQRKEAAGSKGLESPMEVARKDSESPRESKESANKNLEAAVAKSSATKTAEDTTSSQEPSVAAEACEEQGGQGDQQHQQRHPRHRGKQQLKQVNKPETPEPAATLEDGSLSKGNGERGSRKFPRKYQGSRRSSKPQDVRAADKVPAGEGMVWAPIRPSSAHPKSQSQFQPKGQSESWSTKEERQSGNTAWEVKDAGRDNSHGWDADGKEGRRDRDNTGWSGEGKEGRTEVKEGRRDNHRNHRSGWREGEGRGGGRENHRDGWSEGGRSEVREGRGGREQREQRERENRDHKENRENNHDNREGRANRDSESTRDQSTGWGGDGKEHRGGGRRQAHQQAQQADHTTTSSSVNSSGGAGGATGWGGDAQVRGGSNNNQERTNNSNKNWGSEDKESRGGGHHHSRRGPRFGRGGRGGDVGNRGEKHSRMIIDATGGAVPSQVAG